MISLVVLAEFNAGERDKTQRNLHVITVKPWYLDPRINPPLANLNQIFISLGFGVLFFIQFYQLNSNPG